MAKEKSYPRYYNSDGSPARIMSARDVPEVYIGGGQWKKYADREDVAVAGIPITLARLRELVDRFDRLGRSG